MRHATLPATDLVHALREVRYAVGTDPQDPRIRGVYLDGEGDRLRVVATDRYRLATAVVTTSEPCDLHVLLPLPTVDALVGAAPQGPLDVVLDGPTITLTAPGLTLTAALPDVDFPSYRVLLHPGGRPVPVDAARLRVLLAASEPGSVGRSGEALSVLVVGPDGVRVGPDDSDGGVVVTVNRDYLLQALAAGDQLTLAIDDPIAPLAIGVPDRDGALSILMPVRPD